MGHSPHCYDYGTFSAQVVVNDNDTYRGTKVSNQVEGPTGNGSYGRGC